MHGDLVQLDMLDISIYIGNKWDLNATDMSTHIATKFTLSTFSYTSDSPIFKNNL